MKLIAFGILGAVLTSFPDPATAESARLLSEFRETLRPTANTGGARVMGLQLVGSDPKAELQAMVPPGWANAAFCVRTGSSDGLYDSENTYEAPEDTSAPFTVPHVAHSDHIDRLSELDAQGFGIRILGAACDKIADDTSSALALWRAAAPEGAFLLFVNSFDADRLVAFPTQDDTEGKPVECDAITADISVAFDRSCQLAFEFNSGPMQVELVSIKDGRRGRSEFVTIDLP